VQTAAPRVPIIVLSGLDDEALAMTTVKEGAQDYLVKGDFDPPALVRAIRYAVERARILRALGEEREFARTLLDAIPDRMYVKDKDNRFLQINRHLAAVLHLSDPREAIGKTDFDFFARDHAQEAFEEEEKIIRTGEPLVGKLEKEVTQDGQSTWLITTKMPVRDSAGKVVGTFGISKDISEIKRAEEALRASEERYRGLLESVMDYHYTVRLDNGPMVATLHGDGCQAVTGYSRQEYEADPSLWARMIHPDDIAMVLGKLDQLVAGGAAEAVEHRILHKDGSVRWIRNTPTPHFDERGRLYSYDGVVSDITERKEAEVQLRSANARLRELVAELTESHRALQEAQLDLIDAAKMRSLGQLAAGIAHEVKNPLAILLMGVNCLTEPCRQIPSTHGILQEMEAAIARANTIITELLDFSSSKKLELTECDLNTIVLHSLDYVRHILVQGKITVVRGLASGLPSVLADAAKMEQVLINLFTNACHAMPTGGTLTVNTLLRTLHPHEVGRESSDRSGLRLDAGEEVLSVEVHDTGSGIPEDKLSRIFDPFFSTKPVGKGTGLGLAVTRNIIELHGGRIEIRNRPEGGVTVALTLRCGAAREHSSQDKQTVSGDPR
jgi:PAS domain S-box-containing protein